MMESKDHDLLIEIKTQVLRLISDVKDIKDDTARRLEVVEIEKLTRSDFEKWKKEDFEPLLIEHRNLQRIAFISIGGLGLLQLIAILASIYSNLFK